MHEFFCVLSCVANVAWDVVTKSFQLSDFVDEEDQPWRIIHLHQFVFGELDYWI